MSDLTPRQIANLQEAIASQRTAYPLQDICPACGTGHALGPCRFGLCRRCDFPIGADEPKRRLREAFLPVRLTLASLDTGQGIGGSDA